MTSAPAFEPLCRLDGYLPLARHGLIGDGDTAALVGADGAVSWLCLPRFDGIAVFSSLLDVERGGRFVFGLATVEEARQWYVDDTAVLVTEQRNADGVIRLTDAMTLREEADLRSSARSATSQLLRLVEVLEGEVEVLVECTPRGGARTTTEGEAIVLHPAVSRSHALRLRSNRRLTGVRTVARLGAGDRMWLSLSWRDELGPRPLDVDTGIERTRRAWRDWMGCFQYAGPRQDAVRRSAITLKLLDHLPNGAIIAAPTTSLPERIGGVRNWDYRFTWIRDAAFTVYALRRIGLRREAEKFLRWMLDTVDHGEQPAVLYDVDGGRVRWEVTDEELEGYRRSSPVRYGNLAGDQRQHDVYGELLDCAYQLHAHERPMDPGRWRRLRPLLDHACERWREPDHGIWEVRTPGSPFTYSAAMCQVALDRGLRMARQQGLPGDFERWEDAADRIRHAVLEEAWDDRRQCITGRLGGGALDASVLSLPLRRVVPARHERMVATVERIRGELGAGDGLLHRYDVTEMADGLPGDEGAFLLCSFWLVDNLAHQGRLDEAMELYESLCDRGGQLGLLPEQVDPASGEFLGNYPQALSHVGLVSSGVNLGRRLTDRRGGSTPDEAPAMFQTATPMPPPISPDAD